MIPVYTRIFSVNDYGALDIITISSAFLSLIVSLQLYHGMGRFYYEEDFDRKVLVSSGFFFSLIFSASICLSLIYFSQNFSILLANSVAYTPAIQVAILSTLVDIIVTYLLYILRIDRKSFNYIFYMSTYSLLSGLLGILLVLSVYSNIASIFLGKIIIGTVIIGIFIIAQKDCLAISFSFSYLKTMALFSVPIMLAGFFSFLQIYASRLVIIKYCGLGQLGVFSLGSRFGSIIALMNAALGNAWMPLLWSLMGKGKQDEISRVVGDTFIFYQGVLFIVALSLGVYSFELVSLLAPPQYLEAHQILWFMVFANLLHGFGNFLFVGITLLNKTQYLFFGTVAGTIIFIISSIYLIPLWGLKGCAMALLFGELTCLVIGYHVSQKLFPISLKLNIALYNSFIFWAIMFVCWELNAIPSLYSRIIIKLLILTLSIFAFYVIIKDTDSLKDLLWALRNRKRCESPLL